MDILKKEPKDDEKYQEYLEKQKEARESSNWLWIDLRRGRNSFLFNEDQTRFTNRSDAEARLVSKYGVSADVAKRVIDQGAIAGGFNLNVLLDE